MLLHYDAVLQLQINIAIDVCCHSPNGIDHTKKYRCHYACEIFQHTLSPKVIVKNVLYLRLFHWILRIPDLQTE